MCPGPLKEDEKVAGPLSCSAGNPISIANGNKFQKEVDYQSSGSSRLAFVRYYNSAKGVTGEALGERWVSNFDMKIALRKTDEKTYAAVSRPDGKGLWFEVKASESDTAAWVATPLPDPDVPDRLTWTMSASGEVTEWQYRLPGGKVEYYNGEGQLQRIDYPDGYQQAFSYGTDGTLAKVEDSFQRALLFIYQDGRLSGITTPDGKARTYQYDTNGNLNHVGYADGTSRRYLYEDTRFPSALTGIIDESGKRYASWSYDAEGRAISSEHAGGAERVTLAYHADDSVTSTNALGKQTTYHFEVLHDVPKVVSVEGHATASCEGANKNYSYDANGYLASKTNWQGVVTTYTRDERGRALTRAEASGIPQERTITTEWHPTLSLPLKRTEAGRVTTYQYDAQGKLLRQTTTAVAE